MIIKPADIYMAVPNYLIDKIYYKVNGSRGVTGTSPITPASQFFIPHDKKEPFLTQMLLSVDNAVWYTAGFTPYSYNTTFAAYLPEFNGTVSTTADNVCVSLFSLEIDRIIFYKIVGFSIG